MAEKEYIERDAALEALRYYYGCSVEVECDPDCIVTECAEGRIIMALPAADVEEVRNGEWVDIFSLDNNENVIATCNYCKERGKIRTARNEWGLWHINSPRCPNCGAKMKGE